MPNTQHPGQKRLVFLNDLSCFGSCSLTVELPVAASLGVEAVPLPTAVLSTHTGGFTDWTCLDMTQEMSRIIRHWRSIPLDFDGICTGYFCNPAQMELAAEFIRSFAPQKAAQLQHEADDQSQNCPRVFDGPRYTPAPTVPEGPDVPPLPLVLVDPVMGDNGRLYSGLSAEYAWGMKELCTLADVVTPNLTEAALLTGLSYQPEPTDEALELILQGLLGLCAARAVITGVRRGDRVGYACASSEGRRFAFSHPYLEISPHGCGDVFASALAGLLVTGTDFREAVRRAAAFTDRCVQATAKMFPAHGYGLAFEGCLAEGI